MIHVKRGAHQNPKQIARRRGRIVRAIEVPLKTVILATVIFTPICLMGLVFRLIGID